MVTHEPDVGNRTHRIVRLRDGEIQSDQRLRQNDGVRMTKDETGMTKHG